MSEDKTYHNLINGRLYPQKYKKPKPKEPVRRGRPKSLNRLLFEIVNTLTEEQKKKLIKYSQTLKDETSSANVVSQNEYQN